MKRNTSSKLALALETIMPLVMDHVVGGNAVGIRTSCVPACTQGPKTGGPRPTGGDPQSSPIHTCLPSRANCLP